MARRKMSAAGKARIAAAARRRWAAYRTAKGSGSKPAGKARWSAAKRAAQGRKIKAALARRRRSTVGGGGEYSSMNTATLILTRRRIDQELADRLVREQA